MPSLRLIRYIQSVTYTDDRSRQFYKDENGSWRRLRTEQDYQILNALVDQERNAYAELEQAG